MYLTPVLPQKVSHSPQENFRMPPRDRTSASKVRAEELLRLSVWLSSGVPISYDGFPLSEAYIVPHSVQSLEPK